MCDNTISNKPRHKTTRHPTFKISNCVDCAYHICETDTSPIYLRVQCEKANKYIKTGIMPYQLKNITIPNWCPKLINNLNKKERK